MCNKCIKIKNCVKQWINKQGHDRCWYYPDIFREISSILEIHPVNSDLPPRKEFELGCKKYQDEEYGSYT